MRERTTIACSIILYTHTHTQGDSTHHLQCFMGVGGAKELFRCDLPVSVLWLVEISLQNCGKCSFPPGIILKSRNNVKWQL